MIRSATQSQSIWAVLLTVGAVAYGSSVGGDVFGVFILAVAVVVFVIIAISLVSIREPVIVAERSEASSFSFWPILGAASALFLLLGFSVNFQYIEFSINRHNKRS